MYNSKIHKLYNQSTNKKELIKKIAKDFNINPLSVRNNWFGGFYQVPNKHQDKLISIMQNFVNKETKTLTI